MLLGVAIVVILLIYFLGGVKTRVNAPQLTEENIASVPNVGE